MSRSVKREYIEIVAYLADSVDLGELEIAGMVRKALSGDHEALLVLLQLIAQSAYQENGYNFALHCVCFGGHFG